MAEKKVQLSKKDRLSVALRSTFLQGSWNYERMQNGGWCFAMIPAIKKYTSICCISSYRCYTGSGRR